MDEERQGRLRQRFLRAYWIALLVWVAAIVVTLTVLGGFTTVASTVIAGLAFLVILLRLGSAYLSGRKSR